LPAPSRIRLESDVTTYFEHECSKETALLFAAEFGLTKSIYKLAESQPGISKVVNRQRSTALHLTLSGGSSSGSDVSRILSFLISAGADVEAKDHYGQTPLHLAVTLFEFKDHGKENIDPLFAAEADVLSPDNQQVTPIHHAVKNRVMFLHFLKHLESNTNNPSLVIHRALKTIQTELLTLVSAGKKSRDPNGWGDTGFLKALMEENGPLVKAFLLGGFNADNHFVHGYHSRPHPTLTALQIAIVQGSLKMVTILLDAEVNPNLRGKVNGNTALHYAALTSSALAADALLKVHADLNIRNDYGQTAVHIAVGSRERLVMLDILLRGKADLDLQDKLGRTALHLALSRVPTCPKEVQLLLSANASLFIPDVAGDTPFHIGASGKEAKIAALFANSVLSQRFESVNKAGSGARMLVTSPLTISNHGGLCDTLLNSVDEFYSLLDDLSNAGFALGFDVLSEDDLLTNPSDVPYFTGIINLAQDLPF
jgi:ankyrin repeat protein